MFILTFIVAAASEPALSPLKGLPLLVPDDIFITYNLGKSVVRKWAYKTEMRTKTVMENEFCLKPQTPHYSCDGIKGKYRI